MGRDRAGYEMRLGATPGACGDMITGHSFLSAAVPSPAHNPAPVPVTCQHLGSGQVLLRAGLEDAPTMCLCCKGLGLHQSVPGKNKTDDCPGISTSDWLLSSAWPLRQLLPAPDRSEQCLCVCWSHTASRANNHCWTFFDFLVDKLLLSRVSC